MSISKKSQKLNRYQLSGAQKKNGLNTWRYVFNGFENVTGVERKFFIEFSMLNPYLSPSEAVLGFKNRAVVSAEDLQNVLAGSIAAKKFQSESYVVPSYVVVRAGVLGVGAKQFCLYSAAKNVKLNSKQFEISVENCVFSEDKLSGHIDIAPMDLQEHPEYLCDSGIMSWELRYEIRRDFHSGYNGNGFCWFPVGSRTVLAGNVTLDGKVYTVIPKKSAGYFDRRFGKDVPFPWLHISSSNLTSIISGKTLLESSFAVQGIFDDRVSVLLDFEGSTVAFTADKGRRSFETHWDFTQAPASDGADKLHWTVSVHNKKFVIDVDVFCPAPLMFVRNFELPCGGRKTIKMLCGSAGSGEIRLYKRIRRNLELIEHAQISGALCEFGQLESPDDEE